MAKGVWCPLPEQQATITNFWCEQTCHHYCSYPFPTSPGHKIKDISPTATHWQLALQHSSWLRNLTASLTLWCFTTKMPMWLCFFTNAITSSKLMTAQMQLQHSNKPSSLLQILFIGCLQSSFPLLHWTIQQHSYISMPFRTPKIGMRHWTKV